MEKIQIIGSIGQDATIKDKNNFSYLHFSVATNRKIKNGGSENQITTWYNCYLHRGSDQLNKIKEYLTKGKKLFVEGEYSDNVYEGKVQRHITILNFKLV